jgi:heme o synthase
LLPVETSIKRYLIGVPALMKPLISLSVVVTSITGAVLFLQQLSPMLLWLALGVFLLASGASALNQFQEWRLDARMKRTEHRPVPSQRISPLETLAFSFLLILLGAIVLLVKTNMICFGLGLLNVFWYNLIYTYLKRQTAFAVVPGSLSGAVPVLMGWAAAGGYLLNPTILALATFVYLWQIPHFWILLLAYREDYLKID